MTHPSGLQYSYDDLDLVCCHGLEGDGLWMGSAGSKQGRRARCSSMPEGCHQLPIDDPAQTCERGASVMNDDTEPEHLKLMENNGKDLQESVDRSYELVGVGILPKTDSDSEDLQTASPGNFGEFCNSNSGMSSANISCATDSSDNTIDNKSDLCTESCQNHSMCDDSVFKSARISHQQYVSISSNNVPPLSECAGEQPGKVPNHQDTKGSHREGYSRPPEITGATVNCCSAAEQEPQPDLPDVEESKTVISDLPGMNVLLSSANMEGGEALSLINKTVESLVADGECDKGISESRSACSADKQDGLSDLGTLNENTGLSCLSRVTVGEERDHEDCAGPLDKDHGWEISNQTLLEQHNVEILAESRPQGEKSAQAESSAKKGHVRPIESSDVSVINQCCSLMADSNVSSKQMNSGHAGDAIGTNTTQCADKDVKVSVSQSLGNTDQSLAPVSEDLAIPHQTEYSCSKLDTIPEISPVEAKDSSLLHAQKNNDVNSTPNPAAERCCLDDKHEVAEQHTQNLPPCSTEVNEGLHGNRASGPHFSESPASEVADGHREHHQPGATMEASREDVRSVIYNDTQDGSLALDGTYEHADQKEDNVFKVRLRKVRINMIQKLNGCTITSLLHVY